MTPGRARHSHVTRGVKGRECPATRGDLVLTLTDNARLAVQDLATQANLPDGGGLRIAAADGTPGDFDLALVTEAPASDEVIDLEGTHVFVETVASTSLADLALDADVTGQTASFTLTPQEG